MRGRTRQRRGFSLIELVIVVIILAAVTAVAIPRMGRGAEGADISALWADFRTLNEAVELYTMEHGIQPDVTIIAKQLTQYSNKAGDQFEGVPDPSRGIIYGPYILAVPPISFGPNAGATGIGGGDGPNIGWIYGKHRRFIRPNLYDDDGSIPARVLERLGMTQEEAEMTQPGDAGTGSLPATP